MAYHICSVRLYMSRCMAILIEQKCVEVNLWKYFQVAISMFRRPGVINSKRLMVTLSWGDTIRQANSNYVSLTFKLL